MTGKDQDKSLDEYLNGKDGLSSLYAQSEQAEPSSTTDEAILDAAQKSVAKKPGGAGPFSGSWFIPAALAAVLVLAIGITMTLEKKPVSEPYRVERFQSDKLTSSDAAAPKQQAPAARTQENGVALKETRSSAKPAAPDSRLLSEPAPAAIDSTKGKTTAPAEEEVMESAPAAEYSEGGSEGLMKQESDELKPTEKKKAESAAMRWLQSIRDLEKQNKTDEAKKQLADFRRVYPNYPLPEDLKNLE